MVQFVSHIPKRTNFTIPIPLIQHLLKQNLNFNRKTKTNYKILEDKPKSANKLLNIQLMVIYKKINKPIQLNAMYMASVTFTITYQFSCFETLTHFSRNKLTLLWCPIWEMFEFYPLTLVTSYSKVQCSVPKIY